MTRSAIVVAGRVLGNKRLHVLGARARLDAQPMIALRATEVKIQKSKPGVDVPTRTFEAR